MQYSTIIALFASVAVATPVLGPGYGSSGAEDQQPSCSKGSKVSCCSTPSTGSAGELSNILGGSCELAELVSLVPIGAVCPGSNAMCCPTNESGAIDIALTCIPISA